MLLSMIVCLILGIVLGIIVGILPGLHPNTIAAILVFGDYNLEKSVLLFSCLITSNIFEFLSACYLGAPEEGESLVRLPLHNLLYQKRALTGMKIVAFTSVITYAFFMLINELLKISISSIYYFVKSYAWVLLAGISLHLILKERSIKWAFIFFLLSGILGVATFNLELPDPFLPLLTGLFGISSLIQAENNGSIPTQMKKTVMESNFFDILKASGLGIISSIIMALIPSMSPSQVGLISENFTGRKSDELKIASMTSINIADNVLSLLALITIGKARSGVVEKMSKLVSIGVEEYYMLLFFGLFACIISACLLIFFSKIISDKISLVNSSLLRAGVIIFVTIMTLIKNGFLSIIILALSTLLGYFCIKKNTRRSQLLGCLVIPTIIFYLTIYY